MDRSDSLYKPIDPTIERWAERNGLHVTREHKEYSVRSCMVVSPTSEICQIWIDTPDEEGHIGVHVWEASKRRRGRARHFKISAADLDEYLEYATQIARSWLGS